MKPHKILKTFPGSQTGHDNNTFVEGTVRDLSDSLAAIVVKEGWAEPLHEDETLEDIDLRETKVMKPEEKKPAKKGKK